MMHCNTRNWTPLIINVSAYEDRARIIRVTDRSNQHWCISLCVSIYMYVCTYNYACMYVGPCNYSVISMALVEYYWWG